MLNQIVQISLYNAKGKLSEQMTVIYLTFVSEISFDDTGKNNQLGGRKPE